MRRLLFTLLLVALFALTAPAASGGTAPVRASTPASPSPISVTLDTEQLVAGPGERIHFSSTIRNDGSSRLAGLVAHLNILTTDPDVYVDPEDWSPRRTQYLGELGAGEQSVLEWDVRAVTSGPLILYVAVTDQESGTVTASGPLHMEVRGQREVNSQNVLPLVAGVPAGVLVLLGLTGVRRRRQR